jgi:hypothetical protein
MDWKATIRRWLRDYDSYGPEADERFATAFGLRQLADLIEDHPEAKLPFMVNVYDTLYDADHDKAVQHLRGKAKLLGGRWKKDPAGESFYLVRELGGKVSYRLGAPREAICEKRVVGRRPRYIPPPVTHELDRMEDIVEWDCPEVIQ